MRIESQGEVAPGFERVREAFERNWERIEVGASLTVYRGDEKVVDLWGGFQDKACTRPWERDTLVNVYSTTKGLSSIAIAILADQGRLNFDAPVTDYWPEFGVHGKERVTVAQLLSHQGGVCGVDERLTVSDLYNWDKMVTLLAAQKPLWKLGTAVGYHAITWGYLAGELARRITGRTLGELFRDLVARPLGADSYIGLAESDMGRCAAMIGPNHARVQPVPSGQPAKIPELHAIALLNPSIRPYQDASSPAWRRAEIAAANGQANGRGIATAYAPMASGGSWRNIRIISEDGIRNIIHQEVGDQIDLVTGVPMPRSRGFMLNWEGRYGPVASAFGHAGAGGSVGFADPENQIAFGYAMNQMEPDMTAIPRSRLLVDALYACLKG